MKIVIDLLVLLAVAIFVFMYGKAAFDARGNVIVPKAATTVIGACLLLILGFSFTAGIGFIPAGSVGVVTKNWGTPSGEIKGTGVYFVPSVLGYGVYIMQASTIRTSTVPDIEAASRDLQQVKSTITLNYHLNPDSQSLINVYSNLRDTYDGLIQPLTLESLKAVTAEYTAQDLIDKREQVKDKLDRLLSAKLAKYGAQVDNISLTQFNFSTEFNQAIEAKVTQEQSALQAKAKLDQVKWEAAQTVASATAQATALRLQRVNITPTLVAQQWVAKWDGHLPTVSTGSGSLIGIPGGWMPSQPGK